MNLTFTVLEEVEDGFAEVTITDRMIGSIDGDTEESLEFSVTSGGVNVVNSIPGDVNGDGKVNGMDLLRLKRYVSGQNVTIDEVASDVNGDGKVNGMDLLRLKRYVSGQNVTLL